MAIAISNQPARFAQLLSAFLRRASYGSKAAELILYILAVSGLMLWTEFDLPWHMQRTTLAAHIVISLVVFPVIVLPFWLGHREILARSNKTFLRRTGVIIEYSLLLITLSGVYLVFFLAIEAIWLGSLRIGRICCRRCRCPCLSCATRCAGRCSKASNGQRP